MGHFYYSDVGRRVRKDEVERLIGEISRELWGGRYRIERVRGVPVTPGDPRAAQWAFWLAEGEFAGCDAAFTMALLRDGRMEFKVPRTSWDRCWEDQQKVRRRLVRRLKEARDGGRGADAR